MSREEQNVFVVTHAEAEEKQRLVYAFFENGHATELSFAPDEKASLLGNIYVGKVKNILTNIHAAFVEIEGGILCYYPLSEKDPPLYTNGKTDRPLKPGDELLVQVCREAVKTKAPTVTCNLNFAGRYLVLTSGKHQLGISSRLNPGERHRLRRLMEPFAREDFGIIVRTNAAEAAEEELKKELLQLTDILQNTLEYGRCRSCFSFVYKEPPSYAVSLRGLPAGKVNRIVTDDPKIYGELKEYLERYQPQDLPLLHLYETKAPSLDSVYGLSKELQNALRERVWLKSGGYLVIQPAEALTVVDVNTGKYTEKKKKDDTFLKINLEAAKELARQLRLRNLSGIIIADFIDMDREEDKERLLCELADELKKDPVKAVLVDMTPLGLVEITRKKVRKTLAEQAADSAS